jgi:predicted DNA-binding WGR domain protein
MGRLVFTEGSSNKFWEGSAKGSSLTVKWGRVGTEGQSKVKKLASPAAAARELAKLVEEKRRKGYRDDGKPATAKTAASAKGKRTSGRIDIPDVNLRLAIVNALVDQKVIKKLDRKKFLATHEIRPQDLEDSSKGEDPRDALDWTKVLPIQDAILALLEPQHLPKLKELYWGGGQWVQHAIWSQWDGEGGEFDIDDLTGIAACTSLRVLDLGPCATVDDFSPLTGMETLEEVGKEGDKPTNVKPLATLPRLRKLELTYNERLTNLSPLAGHAALEEIDIRWTGVVDLAFALELPKLKVLKAAGRYGTPLLAPNKDTLVKLQKRRVTLDVKDG